jgi:RNA polymerase sigma factor (sigma-70 family)
MIRRQGKTGNSMPEADMRGIVETDRQLLRNADPASFGTLFERHGAAIYNYCFRRTADWSAAEDLTSVVFLEAWRKRKEVRLQGDSLLPWLYGVATNVLRNRSRSLRRYRAALERVPRGVEADFADDVAGRLDDERQMRAVLEAVRQLPKREQDVFALCAWSELSYEEAAVALGVPLGTVRSRLARARARLNARLDISPERRPVPNE